jgi:hypothetical protein
MADRRLVVEPLPGVAAETTVGSAMLTELEVLYVPPSRTVSLNTSEAVTLKAPLSMAIGGGNASVPVGESLTPQLFCGRDAARLASVFVVMASRCGGSLISGLRLQSFALRGPDEIR